MENQSNKEEIKEVLTEKQELFCRNYTQIRSLFGNGTLAYAEAYGYDLENASKDDAVYLLKDGREVSQELYIDLTEIETRGAKKIVECTYTRMYNVCATCSSVLLKNIKIDKRITVLLNEMLTEDVIDARLSEIALNGEDKDSIQAIREFNKLKQRIVEKKDITSGGKEIRGFNFIRNDEESGG